MLQMALRAECDVAVIGAGAAGIGAARALLEAGVDVLVLEASDRAGGRACTQMHEGFPLDLGCGWLHSADDNPLVAIAGEMGLTIDRTAPPWQRPMPDDYFASGEQRAFRKAQAEFYERLEAAAQREKDCPAADLLDRSQPFTPLIDAVSTYVNGCELAKLSTRDFDNYRDTELNYRVTEGYGALFVQMATDLQIAYGCPVSTIDHSGARIRIATSTGSVSARAAIICVSTNMLARETIRITPALPDKLHAAAMLPLGVANKLFLAAERPLPHSSRLFGRTDRTGTGAYHLQPFGRPLIEGYFGGDCARGLETGGLSAFADFAIEELCGMLGNAWRPHLKPLVASTWASEPFALGSYSHALPGHSDKRAVLAEPFNGRLFFAGEATHPHYFSTAHGAYESGLRAACEYMATAGSS
jgi:monoamine oxidase